MRRDDPTPEYRRPKPCPVAVTQRNPSPGRYGERYSGTGRCSTHRSDMFLPGFCFMAANVGRRVTTGQKVSSVPETLPRPCRRFGEAAVVRVAPGSRHSARCTSSPSRGGDLEKRAQPSRQGRRGERISGIIRVLVSSGSGVFGPTGHAGSSEAGRKSVREQEPGFR